MEEIQNFLTKDEKILWKRVETKDLIKSLTKEFIFLVIFANTCIIILSVSLVLYLIQSNWLEIPVGFFIFGPLSIMAIVFVFKSKNTLRNVKDKFKLRDENPREFKEIHMITNKRYIKRIIELYSEDLGANITIHADGFERNGFYQFLDLTRIQAFYIYEEEIDKHKPITIGFYQEYDEKNPELTDYYLGVTKDEYPEVLNILRSLSPIIREINGLYNDLTIIRKID